MKGWQDFFKHFLQVCINWNALLNIIGKWCLMRIVNTDWSAVRKFGEVLRIWHIRIMYNIYDIYIRITAIFHMVILFLLDKSETSHHTLSVLQQTKSYIQCWSSLKNEAPRTISYEAPRTISCENIFFLKICQKLALFIETSNIVNIIKQKDTKREWDPSLW